MKAIIEKVCHVTVFILCPHCGNDDVVAVDIKKMTRKIKCDKCGKDIMVDINEVPE